MTWQPDLWSYNPRDARRSVRATNVAEADEAEERNSKPSQRDHILIYLEAGNAITDIEALRLFQCRRLAARILELKSMGHDIKTRMVQVMSGKRVAEYWL